MNKDTDERQEHHERVATGERIALGEQHGALDGISQLADVSRPEVTLKLVHRIGGDAAHAFLEFGVVGAEQVMFINGLDALALL